MVNLLFKCVHFVSPEFNYSSQIGRCRIFGVCAGGGHSCRSRVCVKVPHVVAHRVSLKDGTRNRRCKKKALLVKSSS